jgi:general secretion pathway protein G
MNGYYCLNGLQKNILRKGIKMNRKEKAFTIVELLVVIVIISMLAVFVAPRMFGVLGKAKRDIAKAQIANIESAVGAFYLNCGRYPTDGEGLGALIQRPDDLEGKWAGPYVKEKQIIDPWGNEYIYIAEGQYNPGSFDIISLGADGQQGGEGENADIYND